MQSKRHCNVYMTKTTRQFAMHPTSDIANWGKQALTPTGHLYK